LPQLEKEQEELATELEKAMNPSYSNSEKDAVVEVRAGTGGDEAAIFVGDLVRMYQRLQTTNNGR